MKKTNAVSTAGAPLRLSGELTIYRAAELRSELIEALKNVEQLEVDLSEVGEIDTSGVQLILAARAEAHRLGKRMNVVAQSQAVCEVFELLGLSACVDPSGGERCRVGGGCRSGCGAAS